MRSLGGAWTKRDKTRLQADDGGGLEAVHKMLDEACRYLEQHDKYNPSGSKDAQHRENLRSELEKHKPAETVSAKPEPELYIRNTKSMPKWLMRLFIGVFGGFLVWHF